MAVSQLYNGVTGALIGPVDEGDGLRQKSWLAEITRYNQEAAETGGGFRAVNYPGHFDAEQMGHRLIGDAAWVQPAYAGVDLFEAVSQTFVLGLGDGTETDWGQEALADAVPTSANYLNTTTDPDDPPDPRGAQFAAFIQSIADGGGVDLQSTDGVLTVWVNGTAFTATGLDGASVTAANVQTAIVTAGWPVNTAIEGGDTLRIWTGNLGGTAHLLVDDTAGTVGPVLFTGANQSAAAGTLYTGGGGPLNQVDDSGVVGGAKPQRRILPGSITVTMTMAGEVVTVTDTHDGGTLATGALAGQNAAGTTTVAGTINYLTGAINLDTTGDAPDAATNVLVTFKALVPIDLEKPVRISPNVGRSYAVINK